MDTTRLEIEIRRLAGASRIPEAPNFDLIDLEPFRSRSRAAGERFEWGQLESVFLQISNICESITLSQRWESWGIFVRLHPSAVRQPLPSTLGAIDKARMIVQTEVAILDIRTYLWSCGVVGSQMTGITLSDVKLGPPWRAFAIQSCQEYSSGNEYEHCIWFMHLR